MALLPVSSAAGVVSIIIDDIGYSYKRSVDAIGLPPEVTLSILPHSPFAREMVERAESAGHEIMLHVPMQSMGHGQGHEPDILNVEMGEARLREILNRQLDIIPEALGINNHQGSLLTRHPGHMTWVMQVLLERGNLYFVDSRTHHKTVAGDVARQMGVPASDRDVFLDPQGNDKGSIDVQVKKVLATVEREGFALVIAHPFPHTIRAIRRLTRLLHERGYTLVHTSEYIRLQEAERWLQ